MSTLPLLFSPFPCRDVVLPNRAVLAPMQTYMAKDGFVSDRHVCNLLKFADGRFGTVFTEAMSIEPTGRNTYGDLGVWRDDHVPGLKRLVDAVHDAGALVGAQIWHSGAKGARTRPWDGYSPLQQKDFDRGEVAWQPIGPSPKSSVKGWQQPRALTVPEIQGLVGKFADAARRCEAAGFDIVEIHGAHGYILHAFYSPLSNLRTDEYGGSLKNRCRLSIEVASAVRAAWPDGKPLFFRMSCIDEDPDGWALRDSVYLAGELRAVGVDVIDCTSGGLGAPPMSTPAIRSAGWQVPFASEIRREGRIPTMAVGAIREATFAEGVLRKGDADLIGVAREALYNPHWPLHAMLELMGPAGYELWPVLSALHLKRRLRDDELAAQAAAREAQAVIQ